MLIFVNLMLKFPSKTDLHIGHKLAKMVKERGLNFVEPDSR